MYRTGRANPCIVFTTVDMPVGGNGRGRARPALGGAALSRSALLVDGSRRLECLRLKRFQVRSRKHDDRAGGIANATRGHRTNQNLVYTSGSVTAHDEQTCVPRGIHEPLDGWPLHDLARQRDVVSIRRGHLVYLSYLSRLSSLPGLTCDR